MRNFARVLGLLPGLLAAGAMVEPAAAADSPTLTKIKSSGAITIGYREASIPFSYLGPIKSPSGSRWISARQSSSASRPTSRCPISPSSTRR